MRILFIGGTGTISYGITKILQDTNCNLTLLNRGESDVRDLEGFETIIGDYHDESSMVNLLKGREFDVVVSFIAFTLEDVQRDYRLFKDITKQYIFISTASAYHKPVSNPVITESTLMHNPYWEYSRNKIACEEWLIQQYKENGFPVTIVRPSHTYGDTSVPTAIKGHHSSWAVIRRIQQGKPVIIHGDGSSLWTLTHTLDFAKGFVGLLGNPETIGQAYHITSDESISWTQIHEIIAHKLGVKLNPCYVASDLLSRLGEQAGYDYEGGLLGDKTHSVIFDNSKIKKVSPDYVASIKFCQGVSQTIDYIMANPKYQAEDPEFDEFCDKVYEIMKDIKI
jgi:nucleoside-diphosphate-sugar epimerase